MRKPLRRSGSETNGEDSSGNERVSAHGAALLRSFDTDPSASNTSTEARPNPVVSQKVLATKGGSLVTGFGRRPLRIPTLLLSLALLVAATTLGCVKKPPSASQSGGPQVVQVQSDDPGSVSYDQGSRRLVVTYRNGSVYEYTDVPHDVYLGIMAAPSRGVYLTTYVNDRYPYRLTVSGSAGPARVQIQGRVMTPTGPMQPLRPSRPFRPSGSRGKGR